MSGSGSLKVALAVLLSLASALPGCSSPKEPASRAAPEAPPRPAAATPPTVGQPAVGGVLQQTDGGEVELSAALAGHTSILVFYRGFW
ncbi:MAG: hypothetical protein R3B48_03620 [Kofleriaceae bacterium]